MKTKLTLSIDKELVKFAHRHADRKNRSISGLFSDFLYELETRDSNKDQAKFTDMVGVLKNYKIDDSKQAIRDAYAKKHLS